MTVRGRRHILDRRLNKKTRFLLAGVVLLLLLGGATFALRNPSGLAVEIEDGRWRMDVTLCSYEFSSLYRQQLEEYPRGAPQLFTHFIPLDDLEESGAVWCLRGYETSTTLTVQPTDSQCYHLWRVVNSPYLERMLSPVENIFQSTYQDGKWTCFLLYDQDLHLLGYTMWGGET